MKTYIIMTLVQDGLIVFDLFIVYHDIAALIGGLR
jgi:hypothetical protein